MASFVWPGELGQEQNIPVFLKHIPMVSGAHPASYAVGHGGGGGDLGTKLTTELHLVQKLRLYEAVIQSLIHLCGLIKHIKNFAFYLDCMLQNICDDMLKK
jgi:hypothetical protein